MIRIRLILALAICFCSLKLHAQKIENLQVRIEGASVIITFEMAGYDFGEDYEIYLYSSHNEFREPLKFVEGDVGQKVKGDNQRKSIRWDAKSELGTYKGKISLEIRGKPHVAFVDFKPLPHDGVFKKGKTYLIEWEGAESTSQLNFEVLKGETKVTSIKNIQNRQAYTWTVPKNMKPGKDYRVRLSNPTDDTKYTDTMPVVIKGGIPIWLLAIPVVVGGAAAVALMGGGDDGGTNTPINTGGNGGGDDTTTDESLPVPPLPGG